MIKKFKTFEEARRDLSVMNPDQAYYDRLKAFFNFTEKLIDYYNRSRILRNRTTQFEKST